MFLNQKNIWNWGAKTDFVIFHHLVVLNSRFALVMTVFPQFQKLRLRWSMVFTKEFEFYFQKFITSLLRNLIFQPSEAPLSMVLQNLSKLISFHYWVPKDLTNFECWFWNFHTLNYDSPPSFSVYDFCPEIRFTHDRYRNPGYGNFKITTQY